MNSKIFSVWEKRKGYIGQFVFPTIDSIEDIISHQANQSTDGAIKTTSIKILHIYTFEDGQEYTVQEDGIATRKDIWVK